MLIMVWGHRPAGGAVIIPPITRCLVSLKTKPFMALIPIVGIVVGIVVGIIVGIIVGVCVVVGIVVGCISSTFSSLAMTIIVVGLSPIVSSTPSMPNSSTTIVPVALIR